MVREQAFDAICLDLNRRVIGCSSVSDLKMQISALILISAENFRSLLLLGPSYGCIVTPTKKANTSCLDLYASQSDLQ